MPRETARTAELRGVDNRSTVVPGNPPPSQNLEELAALANVLGHSRQSREERASFELLGTMAAMLAHELQNVLTPICGYSSLALQALDPDAPARRSVERVHAAAERGRKIAGSIIGLAKGGGVEEPHRCNVAEAVGEAIMLLGREPGRLGMSIAADVPAGLLVAARPSAVLQVVLNALINACRALGSDGSITIAACSTGNTTTDEVLIEISDSGPGLTPDQLHEVRAGRLGQGLGLPISRWLCEASGGRLEVDSPATGGTVVRVSLPVASLVGQDHDVVRA
jgi:signal transduction histidine kinase